MGVLDPNEVSSSFYLYGCEATEFNVPVEVQKTFLYERDRRADATIAAILEDPIFNRDDERLRDCLRAKSWVKRMFEELEGK